jgi:hypothetical protein
MVLLGRLIEKMRRSPAVKHVEDGDLGLQVTDRQVVRGKVECDLVHDDRMPVVIIDGREGVAAQAGAPGHERGDLSAVVQG